MNSMNDIYQTSFSNLNANEESDSYLAMSENEEDPDDMYDDSSDLTTLRQNISHVIVPRKCIICCV